MVKKKKRGKVNLILCLIVLISLVGCVEELKCNDKCTQDVIDAFKTEERVRVIVRITNVPVNNVISDFEPDELEYLGELVQGFGADVTREGFRKLVEDDRVTSIVLSRTVHATAT